jgi:hypothetical protein
MSNRNHQSKVRACVVINITGIIKINILDILEIIYDMDTGRIQIALSNLNHTQMASLLCIHITKNLIYPPVLIILNNQ